MAEQPLRSAPDALADRKLIAGTPAERKLLAGAASAPKVVAGTPAVRLGALATSTPATAPAAKPTLVSPNMSNLFDDDDADDGLFAKKH